MNPANDAQFDMNNMSEHGTTIALRTGSEEAGDAMAVIYGTSTTVRIFAKSIDDVNVLGITHLLNKTGTTLKIYLETLDHTSNIDKIVSCNNAKIKLATNDFKFDAILLRPHGQYPLQPDEYVHFMVGDDRRYRIEYCSFYRRANVCFNGQAVAAKLIETFDKHFDK